MRGQATISGWWPRRSPAKVEGDGVRTRARATLAAVPGSVLRARRLARSCADEWSLGDQSDTVTLLVSELVTNAVLYADEGPVRLSIQRLPDRVRVEVADVNSAPPRRKTRGGLVDGGRGLILVDELSDSWGSAPSDPGKIVWFELLVAALPAPAPRRG